MLCLPLLSLPPRHLQPARIKAAAHLRVTALDGHFSGLTLASQQGLTQLVPLSLKPIFFLLAPRDHPLHSPGVTLPLASGSVSSAALCSFQPLNGQGLQSPALRPLMCSVCPGPHPSPGFSITQPDGSHISISGWHLSCLLDCRIRNTSASWPLHCHHPESGHPRRLTWMVTPVSSLSPCIQPPLHLVSMWEPQTRLGQTGSYKQRETPKSKDCADVFIADLQCTASLWHQDVLNQFCRMKE